MGALLEPFSQVLSVMIIGQYGMSTFDAIIISQHWFLIKDLLSCQTLNTVSFCLPFSGIISSYLPLSLQASLQNVFVHALCYQIFPGHVYRQLRGL